MNTNEIKLRDIVMQKIYDRREQLPISIDNFLIEGDITFKNDKEKEIVFNYLRDKNYINIRYHMGSSGNVISMTPQGVEYVERKIKYSKSENDDYDMHLDAYQMKYLNDDKSNEHFTNEINKQYLDQSIEACFGIEKLSASFLKLIDAVSISDSDNVCMIGIFAPWGRGKSYLFGELKKRIREREKSNDIINYNIVEFNAWKHQQTPAIWAYLFETIYNNNKRWFKFKYTIYRKWKNILLDFWIASIPVIIIAAIVSITELQKEWSIYIGLLSASGLILNYLLKHYNSAITLIKKYTKGISFSNELGIQAEIEKELSLLLRLKISKKKVKRKEKVLLYIDDIDRCPETVMLSIIDSLRTILENDHIRKRLVIVSSIDPEKLQKGIEHKYKDLYKDNKGLVKIAIEQMDKIFLTGIALPELDSTQLHEFLSKLTGIEASDSFVQNQKSFPYSISKGLNSFIVANSETNNTKFSDIDIHRWILDFLDSKNRVLTPRKLRIIYYRILFANNILSSIENSIISKDVAEEIFTLSIGEQGTMSNDTALSDVVDMVVPYRYMVDA